MRLSLLLAAGLALLGCATLPSRSSTAPADDRSLRVVGRATLQASDYVAGFNIALLHGPDGKTRIDLVLPTGMSAAIFWLLPERWLLLDPSSGVAWHGALVDAVQIIEVVPESYRAAMVLGMALGLLNPADGFGRITKLLDASAAAGIFSFAATDYGGMMQIGDDAWRVEFSEPYIGDSWPSRWTVSSSKTALEVEWRHIEPLATTEFRLLEPRVPESFSVRSWRSWSPPAAHAVDPSTKPTTTAPVPPVP